MWLMVLSLSPHSLHLLFCCVLSILALIWLVLMVLFCAAIRRDSFSLLKFPFLSQVQVLLFILILVCFFLHQLQLIVLRGSLSDSKSPVVSRTLLTIEADSSCGLYGLKLFSDYQFFQFLFQAFGNCSYNWYHCHLHVPQLFQFSIISHSFIFTLWCAGTATSSICQVLFLY